MAMEALRSRLETLCEDAEADAAKAAEYNRLLQQAEKLRASVIGSCDKRAKKLRAIERELAGASKDDADAAQLQLMAQEASQQVEKACALKPETGSLFIRLFLGSVNVKVLHESDRRKLKDEYEKFKTRTNWLFLVIPLSWALNISLLHEMFSYTHWITVLGHIWLLYYYVTLALRENILRVNGSRIMSWWIVHHYVSASMSCVMLTWPDTPVHQSLMPTFTAFFLYQAVTMQAQAIYQARRHYGLVAQGKATVMDVANPEGLREYGTNVLLTVLIVLLAGTYAFQGYLSWALLNTAFTHPDLNVFQNPAYYRQELQILFVGVCFGILALFNTISLLQTLAGKWARRIGAQVSRRLSPTHAGTVKDSLSTGNGGDTAASPSTGSDASATRKRQSSKE